MAFLLVVFGALLAGLIVGVVLLIVGVAKKRTGLWVAGLIIAVLSLLLVLPAIYTARRAMSDWTQDTWQEIKQAPEAEPVAP